MKIGEVIRKSRKEHNLTQEEMANRLGVTAPAVNKWEHGNSMPDITLLAPIARLLDVSLDDLLSFRSDLTPDEIRNYVQEAECKLNAEPFRDVLLWCKNLICTYPNCDMLIHNLAVLLDSYSQSHNLPDDTERDQLIVTWYKQGLQSDNADIKAVSKDGLFKYYVRKFQFEEAQKYIPSDSGYGLESHLKQAALYGEAGNRQLSLQSFEKFFLESYRTLDRVFSHLAGLRLSDNDPDGASYYVEKRKALAQFFEQGDYNILLPELDMVLFRKDQNETIQYMQTLINSVDSMSAYSSSPLYAHILRGDHDDLMSKIADTTYCTEMLRYLKEDVRFSYMEGNEWWDTILNLCPECPETDLDYEFIEDDSPEF